MWQENAYPWQSAAVAWDVNIVIPVAAVRRSFATFGVYMAE